MKRNLAVTFIVLAGIVVALVSFARITENRLFGYTAIIPAIIMVSLSAWSFTSSAKLSYTDEDNADNNYRERQIISHQNIFDANKISEDKPSNTYQTDNHSKLALVSFFRTACHIIYPPLITRIIKRYKSDVNQKRN